MESFKDEGKEGTVTVLLGGKVLVIDIDFAIDRSDPLQPRIKAVNAKTSYATMNDSSSNANGSPFLDKFLSKSIQSFCNQLQDGEPDTVKAAACVRLISNQLQYLVLLDGLASRKDSAGVKWFIDLDKQWPMLEGLVRQEAATIASYVSLSVSKPCSLCSHSFLSSFFEVVVRGACTVRHLPTPRTRLPIATSEQPFSFLSNPPFPCRVSFAAAATASRSN